MRSEMQELTPLDLSDRAGSAAGAPAPASGRRRVHAPSVEQPCSISILGATGSVGRSTLDLMAAHPGAFVVDTLTAQSSVEPLAQLALRHRARVAVIGDGDRYLELKGLLSGTGIEVAAGDSGLADGASRSVDCVMASIVGAAGLRPTFAAAGTGTRIALANKECLVSAGAVFLAAVAAAGGEVVPVDSEHAAIFQALGDAPMDSVESIVITASGGPFRTWSREAMDRATPEEAARHPNWSMGPKITIDSATLMNKCLELIEAYHLFPVEPDQLGVVVHPQSIVHGLVFYKDGSVIAQLASPDMRTPIALALAWPARLTAPTERLDLVKLASLTFEAPDEDRFPALRLARRVMEIGGTAGAVLNAANEVAVSAFLDRRISFTAIAAVTSDALESAFRSSRLAAAVNLDDVLAADNEGRALARSLLQRYS